MPWGVAAAAVGAGGAIYSANQAGKNKGPSAQEQIDADIRANNPDRKNPFGSTTTTQNSDGSYKINQTQSPEMQALTKSLIGRAGASRGTFSSGDMPDHIKQRYAQTGYVNSLDPGARQDYQSDMRNAYTNGTDAPRLPDDLSSFMPAEATYDRPEFGFGVGDGPAELEFPEGSNPMADMTDLEAVNYIIDNGLYTGAFDKNDAQRTQQMFTAGPNGATQAYRNSSEDTIRSWDHPEEWQDSLIDFGRIMNSPDRKPEGDRPAYFNYKDNEHDPELFAEENAEWEARQKPQNVFAGGSEGFDEAASDFTQPNPKNYDPNSYKALVAALTGGL